MIGRLLAIVVLLAVFVYDLLASSLSVARIVLARNPVQSPAIVVIPVEARTQWGVAMFANLVSLTPGSTCLHVSDDRTQLYVHVLDARSPDAVIASFKSLYERWIVKIEGAR